MNNITVNMENLSEEERATMMMLIEKANKPKSKVWKPKCGEMYYCITDGSTGRGMHIVLDYNWENDTVDRFLYSIGNCYKTEEEGKFAIEYLKVRAELQRYADENNDKMDWNDGGIAKYHIVFDCSLKIISTTWTYVNKIDVIYFSSEKVAENAIEAIGADRIKKYYLGVED